MFKTKKAQTTTAIAGLITLMLLLIVAGILIGFGADITKDVGADIACTNGGTLNTLGTGCLNSTGGTAGTGFTHAGNASVDAQTGLGNMGEKFPLLGTIAVVGVILAVLAGFLVFRLGR